MRLGELRQDRTHRIVSGAPNAGGELKSKRTALITPDVGAVVSKPSLEPAHLRAKLETSILALEQAGARADEVAAGDKRAFGKLHARLRQSAQVLGDVGPDDLKMLSLEDRRVLGASLGRELSVVLNAMPAAVTELNREGKELKSADLEKTLSKLLGAFAEKLVEVPILPPALEGKDARATVAWLKDQLSNTGEQLSPDQRMAVLYLTDSVVAELKSALSKSGEDPSAVDALASHGKAQRGRVSNFVRAATAAAATAAIALPVLLGIGGGGAANQARPLNNDRSSTPAVVVQQPTVDQREVHTPRRIRVTEERGQQRRVLEQTATAVAESNGEAPLPPAAAQTVVDTLKTAGFRPDRDTTIEEAIATFQTSVGLEPSGVVDVPTWGALEESVIVAGGSNPAFSPAQSEGEHSHAVKESEQLLADLDLLPRAKVDGTFDAATVRATEKFENKHPGVGQDGAIDAEQFRAMARELAGELSAKPEVVSRPSPNTTPRYGADIDTIVLHHTASNDTAGDLATLTSPSSGVSAHYLIGRDGTIYQLVPDDLQSWHAGVSALRGEPSVNPRSIGIEITNDGSGTTPFTDQQYAALRALVPHLVAEYDVPIENIVGHKEIALPAGRKSDPAPNFDEGRVLAAVERLAELERLG